MTESYNFGDMSREQLNELAREWSEGDTIWGNKQIIEEASDESLIKWLSNNKPCPAVKRNGDVCGSLRVSVSGYCFAHDPEAASWRAMGGRAKAKKVRAQKKLKELGLGDMVNGLHDVFEELQASPPSATNARAMAKLADTVMKMTEWASEADKEPSFPRTRNGLHIKPERVGWPEKMR